MPAPSAATLFPFRTLAAGQRVKLAGQRLELLEAAPTGINLEQLDVNRQTVGILLHRFEQDFLSLRIATIGHVDIGFGNRINLVGINGSWSRLAEITGMRRCAAGIDALSAGHTEHRIGTETGRRRHGGHLSDRPGSALAPATVQPAGTEQGENRSTAKQGHRAFQLAGLLERFRRKERPASAAPAVASPEPAARLASPRREPERWRR